MLRRRNPLTAPGMAQSEAPRSCADPPALPDWIRPQLTQLVDATPEGEQWLHEIKFDSFRMRCHIPKRTALQRLRKNKRRSTARGLHPGQKRKRHEGSMTLCYSRAAWLGEPHSAGAGPPITDGA